MNRNLILAMTLATTLAGGAAAQTIQIDGNPVQPGVPFSVTLTNNTAQYIGLGAVPSLHQLQPTGELVAPEIVGCAPVSFALAPGQATTLGFQTPATGPGAAGSFALLYPYAGGAVARLDVGAASAGFPAIHTFPVGLPFNAIGHHVAFPPAASPDWAFANTGSASHTFAAGALELFTPGGTSPVATRSLAGLSVAAGGVTRIALPLSGLVPGPYTVEVRWVDPAAGPRVVRHGIEASPTGIVDLHFPGGRIVPSGGAIPARLAMGGSFSVQWPIPAPPLFYALLLGIAPGSTPLPGGGVLPLALDPLVIASLTNGVGGILNGHIGMSTELTAYCAHSQLTVPAASRIRIDHPNLAVISGLTLRAAGLVIDDQGRFGASQPEGVTFQ